MTRWYYIIGMFLLILSLATYECWIMGDSYMSENQSEYYYDDYRYNYFQKTCEWVTTPGLIAAFLVFDRTDIPEKEPDSWEVAWLVVPSAAIIWTGLLFGSWLAFRSLVRRYISPRPPIPTG